MGVGANNQKAQKPLEEVTLNMADCHNPENNFKDWLKYQKSNWRRIRKDLKADKQLVTKGPSGLGKMNTALSNFMRNMDQTVLNSTWHIISIENTYEPGVLKIWALTEQREMFNVKLNVKRTLYINSKTENNDPDYKKVQKILPRNRKSYHLYEYEMNEDHYRSNFPKI